MNFEKLQELMWLIHNQLEAEKQTRQHHQEQETLEARKAINK